MSTALCQRCEIEAPIDQLIKDFRSRLCPPCAEAASAQVLRHAGWVVAATIVLGAMAFGPAVGLQVALMWVALAGVFYARLVVHELGHAIVGLLVADKLLKISVGGGQVLFRRWGGDVELVFHRRALGGMTLFAGCRSRWRMVLVALGGLAAEVAVAALVWRWDPAGPVGWFARWAVLVVVAADVARNLWPSATKTLFGIAVQTDGALIVAVARGIWTPSTSDEISEVETEGRYVRAVAEERTDDAFRIAEHAFEHGAPSTGVSLRYIDALLAARRWPEALKVMAQVDEDEVVLPMFRNNQAYVAVMSDDPALLDFADEMSAEAFAEAPTAPAITSTRGSVLVLTGRVEEGLALIERTLKVLDDDRKTRAQVLVFEVIGRVELGDHAGAHVALAELVEADPECPLRERAERALRLGGASVVPLAPTPSR